jgi:NAD(P)-dependent dehydrogenase (short-subunit alcohol dehydrogenase family)
MGLLDGKRVVVTGAAAGIGEAVALRCAAEGARVAVLDVDADGARRVAEAVGGVAVVADVGSAGEVEGGFGEAAEALGGIDVVCNNAGVGSVHPLHLVSDDEWARLLGVNLTGVFYGLRAAIPRLRACGGGSIVNVSSLSGVRPTRGEGPYSAAKAGVIALTASAALEYGPEIRVNCVSPGVIATPLTSGLLKDPEVRAGVERRIPLQRVGTASEVASVVVWLASDQASYVTGVNVVVDGGSHLPSAQTDELLGRYVRAVERRAAQAEAPG